MVGEKFSLWHLALDGSVVASILVTDATVVDSILVTDTTVVDRLGRRGRLGFGREVGQAVGWIAIWVAGWLSNELCCLGRAGGLDRAGFRE